MPGRGNARSRGPSWTSAARSPTRGLESLKSWRPDLEGQAGRKSLGALRAAGAPLGAKRVASPRAAPKPRAIFEAKNWRRDKISRSRSSSSSSSSLAWLRVDVRSLVAFDLLVSVARRRPICICRARKVGAASAPISGRHSADWTAGRSSARLLVCLFAPAAKFISRRLAGRRFGALPTGAQLPGARFPRLTSASEPKEARAAA